MYSRLIFGVIGIASIAYPQSFGQRAVMVGGGSRDRGQCTVEVVVDGAAQVEVRNGYAVLRNLWGQPATWRRFECTAIMPDQPADFRFNGVDGRGKQQLIRDPRDGGPAIVRIEDPDHGSEGYTFRISWSAYGSPYGAPEQPVYAQPDPRGPYGEPEDRRYHAQREEAFRGDAWRARFFERIREDLDHASYNTRPFGGDQNRLARTREELDELQEKLSRGFYDERELDDVTRALREVLAENRLRPDDRDVLGDDLQHLREFRQRHERWGAR